MVTRILDIAAFVALIVATASATFTKSRADSIRSALDTATENVEGLKTARELDREECAHEIAEVKSDAARDIAEVKAIAEHASREASAARSDVVKAVADAATQATIEANRAILSAAASALAAGQQEIIGRLDAIRDHVVPPAP